MAVALDSMESHFECVADRLSFDQQFVIKSLNEFFDLWFEIKLLVYTHNMDIEDVVLLCVRLHQELARKLRVWRADENQIDVLYACLHYGSKVFLRHGYGIWALWVFKKEALLHLTELDEVTTTI